MSQELPQPKSGFRSSEFWTVLLTAAVALIPIFLDAFAGAQAGGKGMLASLGVALAAAVYAHGRSRVKAAHEGVKRGGSAAPGALQRRRAFRGPGGRVAVAVLCTRLSACWLSRPAF